jgi:hypothetical protein
MVASSLSFGLTSLFRLEWNLLAGTLHKGEPMVPPFIVARSAR